MTRILTGFALAVLAILIVKRAPSPVIWVAIAIVALIASDEVRRILDRLGKAPWPWLMFGGVLATIASFVVADVPLAAVLAVVLLLAFTRAFVPTQGPAVGMDRVVGTLLPILYVGLTLGHIVGLFAWGQPDVERARAENLVILLLGAVYFGDTMALYGGKTFGRHPMAPGISPKKTWEGAVSGMCGSVLFALFAHLWFYRELPLGHAVVLGAVLGMTGIAGDLAESLLKRAADVKDSGTLLPGHGGMLDRVDSLLLAAPVVYWYHRLLLP